MMNYRKKRKGFLCYVLLLALLLALTPSVQSNATNWSPSKLKAGTTKLSAGDTINYNGSITIEYNGQQSSPETNTCTILEQTDSSGNVYVKYIVDKVSYIEGGVIISLTGIAAPSYTLEYLTIKSYPAKTTYSEGESFNKTGLVVTACFSEGFRDLESTEYKVTPSGALKTSDTYVTISYTDDRNITKEIKVNITVQPKSNESSDGNSFIITANAAAGGSISDAGGHSVSRGDSKTYTISPNSGYHINYVEVDGNNVGAVSSYTFENVQGNHSISAYFLSGSTANQSNASKKNLTVIGSFSGTSGAGSYAPGTKVTIDAGAVPGFSFAGWIASDGIIYPMPTMSYIMPSYDVLLYANWVQSGTPNALSQVTTTNLKEPQLSGWTDITTKLASFHADDLAQPGSPIMKVAVGGVSCYVDAAPIAMLNTRQGTALEISYGNDASFTFYSDVDNSQFTGTDLSYACSAKTSLFFHEKDLVFTQPGAINTGLCINLSLPDAQPGQIAYVYLVNENGTEMMYLPAIVDTEQKISIPISTKVNLSIKY